MNYRPTHSKPSTALNSLRILEVVARFGTGTTAKEITDALQMPQATAYRILNSLVADEYLARTSDLRGFALGQAISGLITAATPPTIPTAARTVIEEFRSGNRFAVHLIMFRNASLRIADEDPDYPLHSVFEMLRYPHASAAGKLMLAELGDSVSPLPRGPLMKLTQHTLTEAQLEGQLAEIRFKGEASEINELAQGSASLALPVRLPSRPAGAALCLSGPAERFTTICEHAEAARELTSRLAPFLF
ncbi:transcriptional regulator, IclR family [Arthrobacter sp. ok909]|jgi:DNA-binding IclR family transcriptional regulator|uniref:IclR family transcriptional regulator n=1 Tax=Arthrobacter sp. ok909 TaxID=1761746 RepID=UPI00088D8F75|nr:IclR family transcriptional regulator C-terminal domain-containing protein [Arthrobacter sp. ok909]SDP85249.1 transcriptional regulator, IclR family [Arthrobacter sp. ok909]